MMKFDERLIGNDLVCRSSMLDRFVNQRWLDHAFSKRECKEIKHAKNSNLRLQMFWAAKESAYKVLVNQFDRRFFSLKSIQIYFDPKNQFAANYNQTQLFGYYLVNQEYLHAICSNKDLTQSKTVFAVYEVPANRDASRYVRNMITKLTEKEYEKPCVFSRSNLRAPLVYFGDLQVKLSISHDGKYTSFVLLK